MSHLDPVTGEPRGYLRLSATLVPASAMFRLVQRAELGNDRGLQERWHRAFHYARSMPSLLKDCSPTSRDGLMPCSSTTSCGISPQPEVQQQCQPSTHFAAGSEGGPDDTRLAMELSLRHLLQAMPLDDLALFITLRGPIQRHVLLPSAVQIGPAAVQIGPSEGPPQPDPAAGDPTLLTPSSQGQQHLLQLAPPQVVAGSHQNPLSTANMPPPPSPAPTIISVVQTCTPAGVSAPALVRPTDVMTGHCVHAASWEALLDDLRNLTLYEVRACVHALPACM